MSLCACGCGEEVSSGRQFVHGHYAKLASQLVKESETGVTKRQLYAEYGAHGTPISAGTSEADYLPKFQTLSTALEEYEKMRRSDATCQACLLVMELPILSTKFFVRPASDSAEDKEIAAFVQWNLFEGMSITFPDFLRQALGKFWAGFSWFEKVFEPYGARTKWKKLAPRAQNTLSEWNLDDTGGPKSAVQVAWRPDTKSYQPVPIPISKLLVFINRKEAGDMHGMALDLETPIPTPSGWKTMGELEIGDPVFDEEGKIRYVVATREWDDRPVFKITFDSADSIVADENHLWSALRTIHRKPSIVTTKEMFNDTYYERPNGKRAANFAIPTTEPVQYSPQSLLVPPYVLGLWLADGCKTSSKFITTDPEIKDFLSESGYEIRVHQFTPSGGLFKKDVLEVTLYGLITQIRALGLYGDKHIPEAYLRGSVSQRIALLQGLMDGDGSVEHSRGNKRCVFTNTNKKLVDGIVELLNSLGVKTQVNEHQPNIKTGGKLLQHRVYFSPPSFLVFRLPRKLERMGNSIVKARRHFVRNVEPIGHRRVKCIQTDAPSNLFLAGRSFVPTHNSFFRPAYKSWLIKDRLYRLEAIALERSAVGVPVIILPRNASADDKARAKQIVMSLRQDDKAGVTIPENWTLYLLGGAAPARSGSVRGVTRGGASMTSYQATIQHHDLMIAKAILAQFMNLPGAAYGSYALSADQSTLLLQLLNYEADSVAECINRYAIEQLCLLNWPKLEKFPKLTHSPISSRNLHVLAQAWSLLTRSNLLTPNPETESFIRETIGFPGNPEET